MLKVTQKDLVHVLVLRLEGRIEMGGGDVILNKAVRDAMAEGRKRIVLNFKGVKLIDSAGLGVLAGLRISSKRQHAVIKLTELSPFVRGVLEVTELYWQFEVLPDEEAAVASFLEKEEAGVGRVSKR